MRKHSVKLAAIPVTLALVAGACGSSSDSSSSNSAAPADTTTDATTAAGGSTAPDGTVAAGGDMDFGGEKITITGSERDDPSVGAINYALKQFGDKVNLDIQFSGDADWESNINTQVQGGNPPNIGIFPQPGKLADFANAGSIKELSEPVATAVSDNWDEKYSSFGAVDGTQYGVPVKTDLKSLVWYQPARFEADGYTVPETFEEFQALVKKMADAGGAKPLCVGIESGNATGWTFTDWTEEMVLRQDGGDFYDQWVNHDVPFNDPKVVTAMQTVVDLWSDQNVFASGGSIAATAFGDNAQPLVDGQCYMHRQANFFAGFFPDGTKFADGSEEAVDTFYFPDINGDKPVLTAGTYAAAFDDSDATMAVLAYMATPEYASLRQEKQTELLSGGVSGFLSAVNGQDQSVYQPLEQGFLKILADSELVRFDGSDLMPAEVGSGSFWTEGTSLVNGDETAEEAATKIEDSWPS